MNQGKYISPDIFVFSKWSRKDYAIFASLGKLIKIGVLKADISQKALLKGLVELKKIALITESFDEDETDLNITDHDFLQFAFSFFGLSSLSILNLASAKVSKEENPFKIISHSEYKVCFLQSVKNRLFFQYKKIPRIVKRQVLIKKIIQT